MALSVLKGLELVTSRALRPIVVVSKVDLCIVSRTIDWCKFHENWTDNTAPVKLFVGGGRKDSESVTMEGNDVNEPEISCFGFLKKTRIIIDELLRKSLNGDSGHHQPTA